MHQTTETRKERQDSTCALKKRLGVSCLQSPEGAIQSASLDQLAVSSALGDLAMVEHQNHVGIGDGAQSVSDCNRRSTRN